MAKLVVLSGISDSLVIVPFVHVAAMMELVVEKVIVADLNGHAWCSSVIKESMLVVFAEMQ